MRLPIFKTTLISLMITVFNQFGIASCGFITNPNTTNSSQTVALGTSLTISMSNGTYLSSSGTPLYMFLVKPPGQSTIQYTGQSEVINFDRVGVWDITGCYKMSSHTGSWCEEQISTKITVSCISPSSVTIIGTSNICVGGSQTLRASYSGGAGTPSYQWEQSENGTSNWSTVGIDSMRYVTDSLSTSQYYRVTVSTGSGCSNTSSNFQITTVPDPVLVLNNPTICSGNSVVLEANVSGGIGNIDYGWETPLSGGGSGYGNTGGGGKSFQTFDTFQTAILTNTGVIDSIYEFFLDIAQSGVGCNFPGTPYTPTVTVVPEFTIDIVPPPSITQGASVTFDATTNITSNLLEYSWNFGSNATPQTASTKQASTTYNSSGSQTIYLTGSRGGCSDQDSYTSNVALPVTWQVFSGQIVNQSHILNWSTASEINNDYFTVEQSSDGEKFFPLGTVIGAGNTSQISTYSFVIEQPIQGISYYRLKQTDFDGSEYYSSVITLKWDLKKSVNIFPNPAQNQVFLSINGEFQNDVTITTMQGAEALRLSLTEMNINPQIDTRSLRAGVYFIHVNNQVQRLYITD